MSEYMKGTPRASWVTVGLFLIGFALLGAPPPIDMVPVRSLSALLGLLVVGRVLSVRLRATADGLLVRNILRTRLIPKDSITGFSSDLVGTPLTMAVNFGRLVVRWTDDGQERSTAVTATTGMDKARLRLLTQQLRERFPHATFDVEPRMFPTLGRGTKSVR